MASRILSPNDYLNYLNKYIKRFLEKSSRFLKDCLDESSLDEIEEHASTILARWLSERTIDQATSSFISYVGHLNGRLASLMTTLQLEPSRIERIEFLICNPKLAPLYQAIFQSFCDSSIRHRDEFLGALAIYFDPFALLQPEKNPLRQLSQQILQSRFYEQYLTEVMSSRIQPNHLFFLGTVSNLAPAQNHSHLNDLYVQYLLTFYDHTTIADNDDLHYCTRGILAQLDLTTCINNESCLSSLQSIVVYLCTGAHENSRMLLLRPALKLLIKLCIESKTAACYLNSDSFIHALLQDAPHPDPRLFDIEACLLLGHVITEQQLVNLRISYKFTMKLIDLLSFSFYDKNAILASLHSLAIHESVQTVIAESYQLTILIPWAEKYPLMYDVIWKLSFHFKILGQLITRHESFLERLTSLKNNSAAVGIQRNIEMNKLQPVPQKTEFTSDLALVYSAKDTSIVNQLSEKLSNEGIRFGDVEQSPCVLLCISEEAKHDCRCQSTIRQALLACRKVIYCVVREPHRLDDWFATLQIQEKSLMNSGRSDLDRILPQIRKEIHRTDQTPKHARILTPSQESSDASLPSVSEVTSVPNSKFPGYMVNKTIQSWSKEDVQDWCRRENLNSFQKVLALYDGRSLLGLAHVSRANAPQTIINQLRNDCRKYGLKVSFVEFVRFQTALDDLLRLEKIKQRKQSISHLATRYVYRTKPRPKN